MAVKTSWSSGDVLTAADLTDTFAAKLDASAYTPGLSLITTQSFSAVSSVSVNNCFSGDYDNFRVIHVGYASANVAIRMRHRVSGSDVTDSNYGWALQGLDAGGTGANLFGSAATSYLLGYSGTSDKAIGSSIEFYDAAANANKMLTISTAGRSSVNVRAHNTGMLFYAANTAPDGFTIFPSTGTITGFIAVYGYKK